MKLKEKTKNPTWMKLDNAATIYPPTLTKRYASMFRMTITLKEKIDKAFGKYFKSGILHGKMSKEDKDSIMDKFKNNEIKQIRFCKNLQSSCRKSSNHCNYRWF